MTRYIDIEGRLAVGGNVALKNMGIANCLLVNRPSEELCQRVYNCDDLPLEARDTFITEGNINGQSVILTNGHLILTSI
jgi:hypothetical protein